MLWALAGAKALSAGLGAFTSGALAKANVQAQNKVGQAQAAASNTVRQASNVYARAQAEFSRWKQTENNKRILDAAGDALAANAQNFVRQADAGTANDFERSIRDAEEQGAQAAAAGASGLSGGVVDTINVTTALRRSRANQFNQDLGDYARYDAGKRAGAILSQGINGMDSSIIFDNVDYGRNVYGDKKAPSLWAGVASAVGESVIGSAAAMFSGKQAAPSTNSFEINTSAYSKMDLGQSFTASGTGTVFNTGLLDGAQAGETFKGFSFNTTQSNPFNIGGYGS